MFPHRRLDACVVYLIMSGASALFFSLIFTVNMVYQATAVGLNPLQLVLVGTLLEITGFLFEIPTGVVADVYSRRLSVIIGTALIGAGFLIEGSAPRFETVLLAQVVWGIGATFISGASDAWVADEIGVERAGRTYLRASQVGRATGLIGIPVSVALASIAIAAPILLGGALFVGLAVFLALLMPEDSFKPAPVDASTSWRDLLSTFRAGVRLVRVRPLLLTMLALSAVGGMFSEGFDRLWTIHILEDFTLLALGEAQPVVWFGVISAVGAVLDITAAEIVRRRTNLNDHAAVARALLVLHLGMIVGVAVFGLAGNFAVALAAYWLAATLRATSGPLFMAWINQHVESNVRATVLSMTAQANAFGQIGGGPVVGAIGNAISVRAALTAAALALSPSLALFAHTLRRAPAPALAAAEEG